MLDNQERMEEIDREKMRDLLIKFPFHCEEALRITKKRELFPNLFPKKRKIVICGMGGSGIGGEILKNLLREENFSIFVNRGYTLPRSVDKEALVFAVSYSGNTEETLAAYKEAKKREISLISICSGGKLREWSKRDGVPCFVIPPGMPPRAALGYLFIPMLRVLERWKWVKENSYGELFQVLKRIKDSSAPSVPLEKNRAKIISSKLKGKIPLIYGVEGTTDVVAHRLKTQFNENSKTCAFWDVFPELNHNEVVSWEGKENLDKFYFLFIRDKEEEERVKKRIEITQNILKDKEAEWEEIWTEGKSLLARIFSAIYLGDWVSFYLALLQRIDPTPVKMIDLLKQKMEE